MAEHIWRGPFVCRECGHTIGDPLYTGPEGHCPDDVCCECHEVARLLRRVNRLRAGLASAVQHIADGYTQAEAATRSGMSTSSLEKKLHNLRGIVTGKGRVVECTI